MLVLTEKLLGIIPGVYPHSCEDHWLLDKNARGTQVTCTNDFCPIKDSHKLKEALDILEFRVNVGNVRSLELILTLGLETHMHIFKLINEPLDEINRDIWDRYGVILTVLKDQLDFRNEQGGFKLSNFMDAWGCEQLGSTRSENIFGRMNNLEEFYNTYSDDLDMANFIGSRLNISPYCSTVLSIVHFLLQHKGILLDIAKYFVFSDVVNIDTSVNPDSLEANLSVCITGEISRLYDSNMHPMTFKPRYKVIDYWEKQYNIPIDTHKGLTQATKFLINDEGNKKGKVTKVKTKPSYHNCVITTSDVFQVVLEVLKGDTSGVYSATPEVKQW